MPESLLQETKVKETSYIPLSVGWQKGTIMPRVVKHLMQKKVQNMVLQITSPFYTMQSLPEIILVERM